MALRIPWDKYETAILMDACQKCENGELSRQDAVHNVSIILRKLAVNRRLDIDDIFRNENGINMQFTIMRGLMFNKKSGLHNASKLFVNMSTLYWNEPTEFEKILSEANMMIEDNLSIQDQYITWLSTQVSSAQLSELYMTYSEIEFFCQHIRILKGNLFETTDLSIITKVKQTVDSNKIFKYRYKSKASKMATAIKYYYQWIRNNQETLANTNSEIATANFVPLVPKSIISPNNYIEPASTASNQLSITPSTQRRYLNFMLDRNTATGFPSTTPEIDLTDYKTILIENYKKGFRIDSTLELRRFRMFWECKYGSILDLNDDTLRRHIRQLTIQHNDFVYLPEYMVNEETHEHILSYIGNLFSEGKSAIYYDALYKEFEIEFIGQRINNADMLKTYLSYINNGQYVVNKSYLASDWNIGVDTKDEVRNYLIMQGAPVQTEDLVEVLSHIPRDKVIWAVAGSNSAEFVRNQKGEYFHADIIELTYVEKDIITDVIQQAIHEKDFMSGTELEEILSVKCPTIKDRYPFLTQLGLRDAIGYKLRDSFSFKGKIISALGKDLSMSDVFADYSRSNEQFTLTQLKSLKNNLETSIYFDSVYANSLRISQENFVLREQADFDISATDAAIDRFCTNDYITIQEVRHFGAFPYADFPWNRYLLEHYVSDFSSKYKLMHINFNEGTAVGAIVKRSAPYESFDDLIIDALANSTIPLNERDALQFLYDRGFIARRKYSNIDQILSKANVLRIQKG